MDKKTLFRIVCVSAVALSVFAPVLRADSYEVLCVKGARLILNGKELSSGDRFDDRDAIVAEWSDVSGASRYVQLRNLSSNTVCMVSPPSGRKHKNVKKEAGLWDRFKSYFSSIKKCSVRAPENELLGGLADNMSQTFYMLDTDDGSGFVEVATAMPLDRSHYLEGRCFHAGRLHKVRFDAIDGKAVLTQKSLGDIDRDGVRTVLRFAVDYVDDTCGTRTPLCDAMNVVLVAP